MSLNESGLTLDGNYSKSGRRSSTRFGPATKVLPQGADQTNKSSVCITIIAGSTAAGHPLPPHFQLKSVAEDDKKRIQTVFINGLPNVTGVYDTLGTSVDSPCSVNCNATAGMDAKEFRKYLEDSICPLYPTACDQPGKRVLLILDGGPGRSDLGTRTFLQARGFHLLPGVPNTTHVTQATDRNYGYFKSMYRKNLKDLVEYQQSHKLQVQLADIPLLVFGKRFGWTKNVVLKHAFDNVFSVEKSKAV